MYSKAKVLGIAEYHPSNQVGNEGYIKHFDEMSKKDFAEIYPEGAEKEQKYINHYQMLKANTVTDLYESVGREYRYEIHNEVDGKIKSEEELETTSTMQIAAAKKVLEKCNMTGDEMDAVIAANQVPEYLVPTSSILVHQAIKGKKECCLFDVNSNCTGMLTSLREAYILINTHEEINRVLVVGGDFSSCTANKADTGLYGSFGDAAAAIILERTDDDCGLVASDFLVNTETNPQVTMFPRSGMYRTIKGEDPLCFSGPTDLDIPVIIEKMKKIIAKHVGDINLIKAFCFSQSSISMIKEVQEGIGADFSKCCYVGNEYGYTGVTSPILSLNRMVEKGKVCQGDYVLLWTVGSGTQHTILLIKY